MTIDEIILKDLKCKPQKKGSAYGDNDYNIKGVKGVRSTHNKELGAEIKSLISFNVQKDYNDTRAYQHPDIPDHLIQIG